MADEFEPIDYTDLVDVVQRLRMIGWRASGGLAKLSVGKHPWPWWENLNDFGPYIQALKDLAETTDGERRQECLYLAAETERVHAALLAKPKKPDADDVIARFVGGEIGDRTAMYVMGWDHWQLREECAKRDLPPMQMVADEGEDERVAAFVQILKQKGIGHD
ncbi:hypothetical protein [Mesorhizobium sp. A623]